MTTAFGFSESQLLSDTKKKGKKKKERKGKKKKRRGRARRVFNLPTPLSERVKGGGEQGGER